jgi:hypothetical protein
MNADLRRGWLTRFTFVVLAAALCGLPRPAAGQQPAKKAEKPVENFYRDARVGDWISYKSGAGAMAVTFKQTVTAKTADEITIKYEQKFGDTDLPATETKINLKEPWDPDKQASLDVTTEVQKLGSGKETLTVAGKRYECEWVKNKTTHTSKATPTAPAATTVIIMKTWTCKDVPLGGAVKTETELAGQTNVMELTGFGRGK